MDYQKEAYNIIIEELRKQNEVEISNNEHLKKMAHVLECINENLAVIAGGKNTIVLKSKKRAVPQDPNNNL